jgi:hypothetical protein
VLESQKFAVIGYEALSFEEWREVDNHNSKKRPSRQGIFMSVDYKKQIIIRSGFTWINKHMPDYSQSRIPETLSRERR